MQHIESDRTKIYKSKEYKRFHFMKGNRELNERKLKKIINEIDNGNDMLRYYPILVKEENEQLMILDGQHRFTLSKFFQRPVYYILVEEQKKMVEIAKVNTNVEKWTMQNFLNCYIENGNEDYKLIQDFMDESGFNFSIALRLLSEGNPGAEGTNVEINDAFKEGTFEVNFLEEANKLGSLCNLFKESKIHTSKAFIIAIYRIWKAEKVTIEDLATAYNRTPHLLTRQVNYKAYVVTLEQIMNVKKQIRIVIL